MRAVKIENMGRHSTLAFQELPDPHAGPGELRVRVAATAVNRADLVQRAGHYPPPPGESDILGLEMAGVVDEAGEGCERFAAGDRVFSLLGGGGYAEYVVIPEGLAMAVPEGMDLVEAAAIPEVFQTAWQALVWHASLARGETALIHAGASGVGTAAIQIARLRGAEAVVTASGAKHALCRALGAAHAIDYRHEPFAERVPELTDGHGADVILDFMGASYLAGNVQAAALDGRIVILALMGGVRAEQFDLAQVFRKRLTLKASTLRNRSLAYKTALAREVEQHLLPAFAEGRLKPVIDRILPWTEAEAAHAALARNETQGKVVLAVSAPT